MLCSKTDVDRVSTTCDLGLEQDYTQARYVSWSFSVGLEKDEGVKDHVTDVATLSERDNPTPSEP